jgi:hypothetical protein
MTESKGEPSKSTLPRLESAFQKVIRRRDLLPEKYLIWKVSILRNLSEDFGRRFDEDDQVQRRTFAYILGQVEAGKPAVEADREHGQTFYRWKKELWWQGSRRTATIVPT